jgi:5-methylcytosine-specific restriction protein A
MEGPIDDFGIRLNAKFAISTYKGGFDLVLESGGGSPKGSSETRNGDYTPAFRLLLDRMAKNGMHLDGVQVDSKPARQLPEHQRQISPRGYSLPIELATVADPEHLRMRIGAAAAAFGRELGKSGGNNTKRLRLQIGWPAAFKMEASSIEDLLAASADWAEPATADPVELEARVRRASAAIVNRGALPPEPLGARIVETTASLVRRHKRDPAVIAWVLAFANGACESCLKSAPFVRVNKSAFLEVHHLTSLAEGGPDTTDNAIACCPNCHREMHFGENFKTLAAEVIARVARLKAY